MFVCACVCDSPSTEGRQLQPSSAVDDLQQNMACYAALNKIWVTMGDCLECKEQSSFNLIGQDSSARDIISLLSKLHASLTPFSTETTNKS